MFKYPLVAEHSTVARGRRDEATRIWEMKNEKDYGVGIYFYDVPGGHTPRRVLATGTTCGSHLLYQ